MRFFIILSTLLALTAAKRSSLKYLEPKDNNNNHESNKNGGDKYLPPATTTAGPIIQKQFYTISAPNEGDNAPKTKHLVLGRPQYNYRIIFVKAPGSENGNTKYSAEFAPHEEKTVIYVLSKKDNDLNAEDISTPAPTQSSKPEVFFIKYKTPEEADAAQKEIKDQYKKLGGSDEDEDEEVAPLTSVVGALDGLSPDGGYDYKQIEGGESSPTANYLQTLFKK